MSNSAAQLVLAYVIYIFNFGFKPIASVEISYYYHITMHRVRDGHGRWLGGFGKKNERLPVCVATNLVVTVSTHEFLVDKTTRI